MSQRDGLDEVISGVQSGSLDDVEEADDFNPNPMADRFRCGQSNDGGPRTGPNEWLASKLDELYNMYTGAKHKDHFQLRAYMLGES